MSLKPLADRVLIKPDAVEQKTASGLYIASSAQDKPDAVEQKTASGLYIASSAQDKPQRGTVVAVGAGKMNDRGERIPLDVHEGDVVIYGKFGGNEIKVDGEEYLLMRADDIRQRRRGRDEEPRQAGRDQGADRFRRHHLRW